jgi:hypothetical protein
LQQMLSDQAAFLVNTCRSGQQKHERRIHPSCY